MSWFEKLTGFSEYSPEQVRTNFEIELWIQNKKVFYENCTHFGRIAFGRVGNSLPNEKR
jgi:hypothetical protein